MQVRGNVDQKIRSGAPAITELDLSALPGNEETVGVQVKALDLVCGQAMYT
jgi:hypothetical protein